MSVPMPKTVKMYVFFTEVANGVSVFTIFGMTKRQNEVFYH